MDGSCTISSNSSQSGSDLPHKSHLKNLIHIYNCKNRLVVLTTEQVYPGCAHLFLVSQANCIKQPERW